VLVEAKLITDETIEEIDRTNISVSRGEINDNNYIIAIQEGKYGTFVLQTV
jgi:hypothetical protein